MPSAESSSALSGALDSPSRPPSAMGGYWPRAASLMRRNWAAFILAFAANLVLGPLQSATTGVHIVWAVFVPLPSELNLRYALVTAPLLFAALTLSQALGLRQVWQAGATAASVATAVVASVAILGWMGGGVVNPRLLEANAIVSDSAFVAYHVWYWSAWGFLLGAYLWLREREAALARKAQAAEIERARAERATMASRLKVLQAKVEPELLFGVLAEVRELYLRDRKDGDALLDDLIAYLRAALPQMRDEASTVAREALLVARYARVMAGARGRGLSFESRVAADVAVLAFPPMLLLPLVHDAAELGAERVVARANEDAETPGCVRVAIEATPAVRWEVSRLDALRRVAKTYLGPAAEIAVTQASSSATATIRFARTGTAGGAS